MWAVPGLFRDRTLSSHRPTYSKLYSAQTPSTEFYPYSSIQRLSVFISEYKQSPFESLPRIPNVFMST